VITYFLDTSAIIDLLRRKPYIAEFIQSHPDDSFTTNTICIAELTEGVYREKSENIPSKLNQLKELLSSFSKVYKFDEKNGFTAGQIRAKLAKEGNLINDLDILIAATCLNQNAILLTTDIKHFSLIPNLQLLTPSTTG